MCIHYGTMWFLWCYVVAVVAVVAVVSMIQCSCYDTMWLLL